jgi:hypothetical protein
MPSAVTRPSIKGRVRSVSQMASFKTRCVIFAPCG